MPASCTIDPPQLVVLWPLADMGRFGGYAAMVLVGRNAKVWHPASPVHGGWHWHRPATQSPLRAQSRAVLHSPAALAAHIGGSSATRAVIMVFMKVWLATVGALIGWAVTQPVCNWQLVWQQQQLLRNGG